MGSRGWVKASHRRGSIALTAFVCLAAAPASNGAEPGYEVTAGVGESDNVARLPSGGKSDTITMEGIDFTWHDRRTRLDANVDADLNYIQYLKHSFGNQVIGNFLGDLRGTLAPELLFWDVADNFGQGRINPLAATSPANRENINYFSTGPELALPLGAETLLDVKAGYGKVYYQTSPLGNDRISGAIGLLHRLSSGSSISLNLRDEHVNYANDVLNRDYNREDAFLRYDAQGSRTTIGADLGYSKLRDPVSPSGGVLARLEFSRKISASSTVSLSFGHQYSDAADAFRLAQTLGGADLTTQTVTQTSVPFTSDHGSFAWNFLRSRTGVGVSLAEFKETYPQPSTLDNRRTEFEAHVSRRLAPTLEVLLSERYLYQKFQSIGGTATETATGAQLTWRAGRRIWVMLDLNRANRHSNLANTNFTEDRVWLTVGYGRLAQVPTGPPTPPLPRESLY